MLMSRRSKLQRDNRQQIWATLRWNLYKKRYLSSLQKAMTYLQYFQWVSARACVTLVSFDKLRQAAPGSSFAPVVTPLIAIMEDQVAGVTKGSRLRLWVVKQYLSLLPHLLRQVNWEQTRVSECYQTFPRSLQKGGNARLMTSSSVNRSSSCRRRRGWPNNRSVNWSILLDL